MALPKLLGPPQSGQGVQAGHDPEQRDPGKDQLVVHEKINRQGDAQYEHESPEPAPSRGPSHRLSIGLVGLTCGRDPVPFDIQRPYRASGPVGMRRGDVARCLSVLARGLRGILRSEMTRM